MIWLSVLLFLQASAADKQIERGQTLFLADKGCNTCHALKGKGTAVGPDLRGLGKVGVRALVTAIRASRTLQNSELWSWTFAAGHFHVAPFGANAADADESNAAQLWSTVYLAIPDPR